MVKIDKPNTPPPILARRGRSLTKRNCTKYDQNRSDYESGLLDFSFNSDVYADVSVKQLLIDAQHSKCCFCERKVGIDGDVEHFRPKGACRQDESHALIKPGYYWLAYEWSNLMLACGPCNQRYKRSFFPLCNPRSRAKCHSDDITVERPLLIDPTVEDPNRFIGFRGEIPYAKRGSARGARTISITGIDRAPATEDRREHLEKVKLIIEIYNKLLRKCEGPELREVRDKLKAFITDATSSRAEYSSATKASVSNGFEFIQGS
jgi:uncharacterized protein (TIGR02646 family)